MDTDTILFILTSTVVLAKWIEEHHWPKRDFDFCKGGGE